MTNAMFASETGADVNGSTRGRVRSPDLTAWYVQPEFVPKIKDQNCSEDRYD
jgi:hypothetical protein